MRRAAQKMAALNTSSGTDNATIRAVEAGDDG
jgi:hypothetical protein